MADTKISALTDGTAPAGSDQFPAARAGANVALTWTELLTAVKAVTLDLFAAPGANVAMNAKKLTGLAAGSTAGDSLRYEQLFTAGAVPIADLADPTTGKVIGSTASAAAAVFPPGYEFGYDQITGNVTVTSTTEATPTTLISCAAHTFDGAAVMVEFYAWESYSGASTQSLFVTLFEGATEIARIGRTNQSSSVSDSSIYVAHRFTPTAASHTYIIGAYHTGGTDCVIAAGSSGTAAATPCFVRFTKV